MIWNVSTKMKPYTTTLGAYDLIVGMDWLESHRALVDCYKKKVFCNNDFGEPVVIEGCKRDISLHFIAAAKVKKCIRKGCRSYAVEAMNDSSSTYEGLHPILSEFADVFPPDLPGLPPAREFDFSIPLKPGAEPISQTP